MRYFHKLALDIVLEDSDLIFNRILYGARHNNLILKLFLIVEVNRVHSNILHVKMGSKCNFELPNTNKKCVSQKVIIVHYFSSFMYLIYFMQFFVVLNKRLGHLSVSLVNFLGNFPNFLFSQLFGFLTLRILSFLENFPFSKFSKLFFQN